MESYAIADRQQRISAEKLCYLFLVFVAGCFVGWIYEEIFYWITEGLLRNRGILYGPWLLFLCCVFLTGVVEYIIGYVGIQVFGLRLWDYRGLFLNLQGIICLRSVLSFGILGLVFHYLLEPLGEKLYRSIPGRTVQSVSMFLLTLFIADCVLSFLFRTPITY